MYKKFSCFKKENVHLVFPEPVGPAIMILEHGSIGMAFVSAKDVDESSRCLEDVDDVFCKTICWDGDNCVFVE